MNLRTALGVVLIAVLSASAPAQESPTESAFIVIVRADAVDEDALRVA